MKTQLDIQTIIGVAIATLLVVIPIISLVTAIITGEVNVNNF